MPPVLVLAEAAWPVWLVLARVSLRVVAGVRARAMHQVVQVSRNQKIPTTRLPQCVTMKMRPRQH